MLVHSLWQGFLAAVIAGIIILCTRKSSAALRYHLLMLDLLVLLTAAGLTFSHELGGSGTRLVSGGKAIVEETRVLAGIEMDVPAAVGRSATLMQRVSGFLNRHSSGIVVIWMFCLLGQLVHLTGGLYQMTRLRRYRVFPPDDVWKERLSELMTRLGVRRPVELLQSALIHVPVTFGFLKPMILVPFGMLANLPADQAETILLHELAHIRRNDYLANLVLHITEAIFFFNPGLRWIGSLIRDEREACCDDMVLQRAEDRNSYFDALVAFRELTAGRRAYGMQLGTGKADLLWRIRRMLNQENKKLRFMEKAILSFGLTAILAICLITLRAGDRRPDRHKPEFAALMPPAAGEDTVPVRANAGAKKPKVQFPSITTTISDDGASKKYKIDATDADGNTFLLTKVNDEVTELVINGKAIPQKDFDQYLYIFEEIESRSHMTAGEREGEGNVDAAQRELEKAQERLEAANQAQEAVNQAQAEAAERKERADQVNQEAIEKAQEAAQAQAERLREQQDSIQEKLQEAQEKIDAKNQEMQEKMQEAQEKIREATEEQQATALEYQQKAREYQQRAQLFVQQVQAQQFPHNTNSVIRAMIDDIVGHGLVGNEDDITSFRLDRNGLMLNGQKVKADVSQEFRDKYLKGDKDHYLYQHNPGGGIHTEEIQGN